MESQHDSLPIRLPRIGEPAPDFEARSSHGPVRLSQYKGRWLMLFSHPNDFTPVCTTEIMEFARRYPEFQKRGIDLLGLSVDGVPAHIAWMNNMAEMLGKPIPFPIIADVDMTVAKLYGMIHPGDALTETVRAVFFIDDVGMVRALLYYPLSTGRSVDELLRVFDSLQVKSRSNYATPVDWHPGEPVVVPAPASLDQVETPEAARAKGLDYRAWYLRMKQPE
jgi:peroxiredoxin (alkyl hydroperoxide reductase subunit C)